MSLQDMLEKNAIVERVKTFKMMLGLLLDIRVLLILIVVPNSFIFYML